MYSDRSEWKPSRSDVIYINHFVGNTKSVMSNNPGYIPKIFPTQYKNKEVNYEQVLNRYNRNVKRCESAINRQSMSTNSSWKKSFKRRKLREDDKNKRFNIKD
ncbi:hypothetical protein PV328_000022 [Microctonus aethiopoides]|uniref:Uncharacterized protein n=1 Tax=Microctonus aethiopoides TaxID=144406 RepID=A0AA39FUP7_9HYME|nr:hypothetical protein PV328_000022 [Microctonus aethiopoides]